MLSPDDFEKRYPPEKLAAELPDAPISSLRSLQYLYGKLYTLATAGGGQFAPYLTPDAASNLIDTGDSLIVVRVDLSGSTPRLAADNERGAVWVTKYSDDRVEKVGHCKYAAARGIDHSITHQAGRNSKPEKLARYAKERLTKWAVDDEVQKVAADHEDGWIIDGLAALSEDEAALDTIERRVEEELDGESATALLTVQVRTQEDGEYQWPGTLDVFNEAMRGRKLSKLVTKNKATNSSGDATDLVSGASARTVGTSEDPQNYYLGKQLEKFPGLDIEEAWRTHPISEDAAVTVMNAETFVEACTYRTFGTKVYYLPYFFGRSPPEETYELYRTLYRAVVEDGDGTTPVEDAYDIFGGTEIEDRLRFYVSAVMPHQMSRYDVFGETLNGRLLYPRELAREHDRVVSSSGAFNADPGVTTPEREEWTAPLPTNEKWDLLVDSGERLSSISTGWYFFQTFAERDDTDADADDPRIGALVSVLSGDSIAVETLLSEYVDRIIAESDDDEGNGFPFFLVASQFAQLCALAKDDLDMLTTSSAAREPITHEPTYENYELDSLETMTIADGGDPATAKLESFIENTPALKRNGGAVTDEQSVNNQRRGAFLLGALVGAVGNYQEYHEERSTTLVDNFPVKSLSQSRIKKVAQETVAKTLTYTRERKRQTGGFPGTLFEHLVEELRKTILDPDPDEWALDTDDLRFYYALGVTYGMNDRRETREQTTDSQEAN
ncbi:type I-B CRISPR-associated protein Cas8b/Csh1 [Haloarcula onubensis]|uniref:Type I-B CRISPR-associated protein Cas8b/Csh1 n=1 Tax=Haloarcula onubensis TaxID=2950539 RepID=A0ABU2FKX2_9EURY|nr:type I-B CRISPR-associated protein Cas8b/Csh1 [Halomicroarcula sp. S3CR25-11]MDS0281401.1 type I-B CRISPR-associated protein Cas8b/Csh1 [Halomicroarcula sp. S3CR25-11]